MAKKEKVVSEQPKVEDIPKEEPRKELVDKVKSLKQIINIHDLLNQGTFQGFNNKRIAEGLDFLTALHKQLLADAQNDDQAHLIPELIQDKPKGE